MKRQHTIRPDFVIDNIRDLQEDPLSITHSPAGNSGGIRSTATFTVNVTNIALLETGQLLTINNIKNDGTSISFRINDGANMSATDGTGSPVSVTTQDATTSTHLATVLTTAINGVASESDALVSAVRVGETITITKTSPGLGKTGNETISSNIHGLPTITFEGGRNPSGYMPLRLTIPGIASLRTNPISHRPTR